MIHQYERLLNTYAYNILGSYEDAKDIVQDAYLKFIQRGDTSIEDTRAYLVRTVINLSINKKNRQKRERTAYPGAWLPEPVTTEHADRNINRKEILAYSLMVLLEKLNSKQRAVFILKEAFAYDHAEIATVLGITEAHSRKLLSRAKIQLDAAPAVTKSTRHNSYIDKYLSVIARADMQALEQMLHDEITVLSDGGGKVSAFRKPIFGKKAVIKVLLGIYRKFYSHTNIVLKPTRVNHQPALCYFNKDKLVSCQVFGVENGRLQNVFFIRNPDKLQVLEKSLAKIVT